MIAPPYQSQRFSIDHESAVGHARRVMVELAENARIGEDVTDRAALVLNELAMNVVRHARGGDLFVQVGHEGVEIVTCDAGPGIANVAEAMRDGHSTAGTAGNGLGAVKRTASWFELHTLPGVGTIAAARVYGKALATPPRLGALCIAKSGETVVGDGWSYRDAPAGALLVVADGLGHGPDAAHASATALRLAMQASPSETLVGIAQAMHLALKATRGAAIALVRIDNAAHTLTFLGVGNIAGSIFGSKRQNLASQNGTIGALAPRLRSFTYPFEPEAVLIMHSDGIATRWSLEEQRGLFVKDPLIIAGALWREAQRGTDDATAVVLRGAAA